METLALLALAVVPLLPSLRAAFVYDDTTIIRDNVLLRGWGALVHVWSQPYWPGDGVDALGLYRPLHVALLAVVWNITGGAPIWFHLYALLLHAATTYAVWWLLRRGVGRVPAFAGAAWFATQPLHVEAVASVANTSELLVSLCIVALVAVFASRAPSRAGADVGRAMLVGVLAAAALAAKESGLLALPLAALTVWGWTASSTEDMPSVRRTLTSARAWSVAVVCITAVLLARLVVLGAPVSHASIAAQGLSGMSTAARETAMVSLWPRIGAMLAWPTDLSPYYGPTIFPRHGMALALLGAAGALAVFALAIIEARKGDRRPLVALAWVALTYLPASNLLTPTGQILADRTLFGATVGAALAASWAIDRLSLPGRRAALVLIALVSARNAISGAHYAVAWTSHRALWTRLAEVSPDEHLSYKLLGMDARARGDTARALPLLTRALAMAPTDRQIRFELGQAQYAARHYAAASATLAPLLRDADARSERGFVALYLDAVGRSGGPAAVVRAASPLLHSETAAVAALFLGVAQEQLGDTAAADASYRAGLAHAPGDTTLLLRRAALHSRAARP